MFTSGLSWNVGFSERFGLRFGGSRVVSGPPRGGCARYSGRFDISSMLICFAAVIFDTISTLF